MKNPHAEEDHKTLKVLYPDRFLVFHDEKTYELWSLDALNVSHILGLPVNRHIEWDRPTADQHLKTLLQKGYKVALLEKVN